MIRRFLKITQKIAVFLLVFVLTFTNGLSYFLLALNTVYENYNIVDKIWKAQLDGNVVDRFTPLEKIAEGLKVPFAEAALGDARAVYGDSTLATPNQVRTRSYTGSTNSWAADGTTSQTTGTTIRNTVVRYAPTRDEALAGVWEQSGSGSTLRILRWNGSTWSTEWSTTTTNTTLGNNIKPFDIEYERSSGDAIVVYSTAAATTNELAYRTWNGTTWVGPTNFDVVGTTALACGVELQNRPSSDRIAMIYTVSATTNSANAAVWNGSGWESNPSTPLETGALEAGTACSFKNFDIAWEETSGEILAAWGRNAVTQWAYSACTGVAPCTWGATALAGTEDGTVLDMATQPGTNNIAISVSGNAGADEGAGFWNGSSWSSTGTPDAGAGALVAGDSSVGVGWLTNGGTTKAVLIYADAAAAGVDYASVNAGVVNLTETQCGTTPPAVLERQVKVRQDPNDASKFLALIEDANSDLWAIRFTMDGAGAITCADTNGGVALNANLTSVTSQSFDFDYELAVLGPDATSYTNTEAALNFSACATTGCGGRIGQAITVTGTAFGTVAAGSRANCAGGAGTGCVRVADTTIADASVTAWSDTSITFTVPSGITVFGGAGTTCGVAGANGVCVTAAGVNDTSGALQFFVFPDITSVSPSGAGEGREGASITITGNRFDTSTATGTVDFLNCPTVAATITSWGDTSIGVTVPSGITDTDDSCDVRVTRASGTGSKTDTSTGFVVLPDITGMAAVGTNAGREHASGVDTDGLAQLNGNHFGITNGTTTFAELGTGTSTTQTIHGTAEGSCTVAGWAAAGTSVCIEINTTITDSVATGTATLTRTGDSKTDTIDLRVLPRITSNSPTSGIVADLIQIKGNHFCQSGTCPVSPNRSTTADNVKFGSTQAADADFVNQSGGAGACNGTGAAWTQTEICVRVPTGTPTGSQPTQVTSATSFTSNTKAFTVASTVPSDPTNLEQKKSDGTTLITTGADTNQTTVILEGDISAGSSITMFLEVEVKAIGTAFNGVVSASSSAVTGTSFANQQATVTGLTNATSYHWRARVKNATTGETSVNWVAYGSNPAGDGSGDLSGSCSPNACTDFRVDTSAPVISLVCAVNPTATSCDASSPSDLQAQIRWSTDENATRQVGYGTTCPGTSGQAGFDTFTSKEPTSPTATSTSPHSVTLSGLTAATTYNYRIRASDAAGNVTFDPAGTTCSTFTTAAAQTRIMKTLDFFVMQATTTVTSATSSFDVFIAESKTDRSNITIRNAYAEVFGIARVSSGDITVDVGFQSGLTPSGTTTYTISPGGTGAIYWNIIKQATDFNWDCAGCTDLSNTLGVTLSGTGIVSSGVGARLISTYNYVP